MEYQGGAFDPWGGLVSEARIRIYYIENVFGWNPHSISRHNANIHILQGFAQCAELLNHEFERVFYKNTYASGVALLNIYMICETLCISFKPDSNVESWRNKLGEFRPRRLVFNPLMIIFN